MFSTIGRALLDFVYPPHCRLCHQSLASAEAILCDQCWSALGVSTLERCWRCSCPGRALRVCNHCVAWDSPCERVLVLGRFAGVLREAIHVFKFKNTKELGQPLGRLLAQLPEFTSALSEVDLFVPVPLHPTRHRERGYNQSALIAAGLAEVLGKDLSCSLLKRQIATRQQASLGAAARRQNLENAFQLAGELKEYNCIGVVDDVVTTGATLDACARVLQEAGAPRVWGLALACPWPVA